MHCQYHESGRCRSCRWLDKPYACQLEDKQRDLTRLLADHREIEYLPPVTSRRTAFRNKAKMAVGGSVERPIFGAQSAAGETIDLCDCPLYPQTLRSAFPILKTFIARAGLTPYNIARKRGELKFILLTQNDAGDLMLRFVLRSELKLPQLEKALPWLLETLPQLNVVSANIQPIHMAILEGKTEIPLTPPQSLSQQMNNINLFIRPGSFFQTNSEVAAKLYAAARQWVEKLPVKHIWDLFCGVGGFGLHCADKGVRLTGIEISAEAIACAKRSAELSGLTDVHFQALDLTRSALESDQKPDLVIMNPPRRGIGAELCRFINQLEPEYMLYSSCNAESMAKDIACLMNYRVVQVQIFDMFPNTPHYEVLALLIKNAKFK